VAADRRDVLRVGYFGSYARGDWSVGSDLDLVVIVADTDRPFEKRGLEFDTTVLPVPTDLLVYKKSEWDTMLKKEGGFLDSVRKETIWVYP
jgi:predicted nucleotidyltransferase